MGGISTGEKMLLAITFMGMGLSAVFSVWIINQGLATDKALDYITEVTTDIRTMKRMEQMGIK